MTRYRLAVDTGGTFTDFCLLGDNGDLHIAKEPSTPEDPATAVLEGMRKLLDRAGVHPEQVHPVLHGTTVATNAILEQKGARTALVTTRGFKDVLVIGRQTRPHLYNFWAARPPALVPRELVLEINERVTAGGAVLAAPDRAEIASLVKQLRESGVESVAVCLLHAYANPAHELLLKESLARELPGVPVTVSAEVLPEFREYERTATTVITALVRPRMERYISRLDAGLGSTGINGQLFIMQSNGGVISPAQACRQSARTVLSGPAGGVLAGVYLSRLTGHRNLVTADMGGTSMDISLIHNGEPRFTTEGGIGGYPLRLPMLDIHTIGAGGGSIARVDAGGALQVGPRSAGSVPGPACYNRGGKEPTVTDANLVLGRLHPADFQGLEPVPDLAARCIEEKIARPLGLTLEQAAEGIIRVVNANMARAARVVSVQKGHDPRDFALVPFGGAGPLHAVELARELGIPRVLLPPHPGVTSAWGMLSADVRHDYSLTHVAELGAEACTEINRGFAGLAERGQAELQREGFTDQQITLDRFLDLRYRGQSYEITLGVPGNRLIGADVQAIRQRFHRRHQKLYGHCREDAPVEVVALRLAATGALPGLRQQAPTGRGRTAPSGTRRVYLDGAYRDIPVYHRASLAPGWTAAGPAVIVQPDTTILAWPGSRIRCDLYGNLVVETGGM